MVQLVIQPKEKTLEYDKDLVVVLSDWTNEKPMNVLRNLKRGNEWYQVKKGTAVPLSRVIKEGALGAQFKFWRDRMEGADIADIYYPAFLSNGKKLRNIQNLNLEKKYVFALSMPLPPLIIGWILEEVTH